MKFPVIVIVALIIVTDLFDTISQLSLKSKINALDLHIDSFKKILHLMLGLLKARRLWVSFFFSTLSLLIWLFVLSKADLNFAYSIDSMRYIFIAFASWLLLRETVSPLRWLGIISIVLGIILVTLS